MLKGSVWELGAAVFCAVFGAVYEHFSFGVYSNYMIYAFMFPLAAGLCLLITGLGKKLPSGTAVKLLHLSSLTLALGSLSAGVIHIYGTDSGLLWFYPIAGGLLLLASVCAYIRDMIHVRLSVK